MAVKSDSVMLEKHGTRCAQTELCASDALLIFGVGVGSGLIVGVGLGVGAAVGVGSGVGVGSAGNKDRIFSTD